MGKIKSFLNDYKWIIIGFILLQIAIGYFVPRYIVPFRVDGESMENTLHHNDLMIGKKYNGENPKHGEVIVFQAPNGSLYIKRIIGVPGDTISIKGMDVILNGKKIQEDYINPPQETMEIDEIKIPDNKYFVMGDNRDNSVDSRYTEVGLVDMSQIKSEIYLRLNPSFRLMN
ncbi:MAG: signal peptidase I [Clostridium sp.]|uniref:signal peptidase I n=1 Tax=Clostridium sp. TaxID=1506 RepID=UPI002FCA91AE